MGLETGDREVTVDILGVSRDAGTGNKGERREYTRGNGNLLVNGTKCIPLSGANYF